MDAARLKSELFIAFEEMMACMRRALSMFRARANQLRKLLRQGYGAIARLGRRIARKPRGLQEPIRTRENGLQRLLTSSLDPVARGWSLFHHHIRIPVNAQVG